VLGSLGVSSGAGVRARACCLRRLRFSRSAAASRAVRAARASALPTLAIAQLKACRGRDCNLRLTGRACARHAPYGKDRRAIVALFATPGSCVCCRSSVVEHSLGKGEVVSSILTGSTRNLLQKKCLRRGALPCLPRFARERVVIFPHKLGENQGTLFYACSAPFHRSASRWSPSSRCLGVKRDLRGIIESIVSAATRSQSSNQTARPKADALNVRPATPHEREDLVAPNALASSPAVSSGACEILVPTESRIKKRFAAIKQTVSHSEQGYRCEQHSLVVDRVTLTLTLKHKHKHVQTTSWGCTWH
jgi:hypothetical protein